MITDSNIRSSSNKLRISDSLCFCDSKLCYLKWNSAPQLFMCDGMCTRNKGNMLIGLNIEIRFHKYNIHGKKLSTFIWMVTIITFFFIRSETKKDTLNNTRIRFTMSRLIDINICLHI
jgi:hypothetical protein